MKRSNTETRSPRVFPDITGELLEGGHSIRFQAPGRSMHPTIRDGETITVEPTAPSEVRKGDIILYRDESGVIAHRVVRIEQKASSSEATLKAQRPVLDPRFERGDPQDPQGRSLSPPASPERSRWRAGAALSFILRGDASVNCDFPVEREQVLGKVVSVERAGRSIDLYTWRAKMVRIARSCASRLKRWMMRLAKSQGLLA